MPKIVKELSPIEIKRITSVGMHAVGGVSGLLLQVKKTGARSWIYRTTINGKRRHIGFGGYPTVTLAMARELAREAIMSIRGGTDPIKKRKAQLKRSLTFADAVTAYLDVKLTEFSNPKHKQQWGNTLRTYANPIIGNRLVDDLQTNDILRVMQPIWADKTVTATRLRGRIENVLSWATVSGHRTGENPARWKGNLSELLPKPSMINKSNNHPAIALDEASSWFSDLRKRDGMGAKALEFLAICAARSGEIRGATWDEIDLDNRLWIIPAERMKASKEHRVPLTDDAVAFLNTLPRFQGSPYVFPSKQGGILSDMSISAIMRRMPYKDPRSGKNAVPHGLRSTFRDWAAERTEFPSDMAEISMSHTVGNEVERAYRRGDMVEKRRAMMQAWHNFLNGKS